MSNKTKTIILFLLAFATSFGVIFAWTGPTTNPPSSNTPTPINVGANPQIKGGSLQSSTDMRAPIYYDYPSTSYYLDPGGVSKLNDLYTYDDLFVGSSATDDGADMFIADKIYDWDNTNYYINPASTSVLNGLTVSGQNVCLANGTNCQSTADNLGNHSATQDLDMNNHTVKEVNVLRLNNGFELQQGGSNYGRLGSWLDVRGYGLYSTSVNGAHFYPNTSSTYGAWQLSGTRGGYSGINYGNYVTLMMHSTYMGAYNDRDNEWLYYAARNGAFNAMYNGATKLTTTSAGVTISGTLTAGNVVSGGQNVCRQNGTYCPASSDNQTLSEVLAQGNNASNREMVNVNGIRFGSASSPSSWQIYGSGNMYTSGYWRGDGGLYVGDDEYFYRNSEDFIRTGDHLQSDASMRAPIFYDSNNTGYYVNPASTSYLNDVRANIFYDRNNTSYYVNPAGASIMSDVRASIFYDRDNTGYYINPNSTSRTGRINADNLYSYGWVYGTIFYDRNNTGYYVDPASTSRMNAITPNSIRLGGVTRTSWPSSGITSESDTLNTVAYRGNTTSNWIQSNSSMRAPLFYDSNNTGYYVDPASTSYMNAVRAGVYYDRNSSSYLVDPSGTSYLNVAYIKGISLGGTYRTSWPSSGSGDITAVYAGTGLVGGASSGNATLSLAYRSYYIPYMGSRGGYSHCQGHVYQNQQACAGACGGYNYCYSMGGYVATF